MTGSDIAEGLVVTARDLAAKADVDVRFDVGDCKKLPYADASFDVVSSAQGIVFAPDHRAVAGELIRLCAPDGRVGLTAWRPGGGIEKFMRMVNSFQPPPPEGAGMPMAWGRREYVQSLLGDAFALEFFDGESPHAPSRRRPCGNCS